MKAGSGSPRGWSVFAIDPGETSGWAWACVGVKEPAKDRATGGMSLALRHRSGTLGADRRVLWGQVPTRVNDPVSGRPYETWESESIHARELVCLMKMCQGMGARSSSGLVPEISTVVMEDFILREGTQDRSLLSPVRLEARTEAYVFEDDELEVDVHLQSASDMKRTVTEERLKRWGFWVPGQRHARDALRHLLLYMREATKQT